MGAASGFLKIAINGLQGAMSDLGKEIDKEEISDIVLSHAVIATGVGVGGGLIPGVGPALSIGGVAATLLTMYVRLAKAVGVTLKEGTLKALISGIVADLSSVVIVNLGLATIVSFVPGVGSLASAALSAVGDFAMTYIGGYIFIKMLTAIFKSKKDITKMGKAELTTLASSIIVSTNMKAIVKEAKNEYTEHKEQK